VNLARKVITRSQLFAKLLV